MQVDTLILGAGAAGLMCAAHAPGRVLLVDHAMKPGEKIRISGGGRCNFTNLHCAPHAFISRNPHFCKSALARYTQWDFIDLVDRHGIAWHEKTLGQLFCDGKSTQIVEMLTGMVAANGAELWTGTQILGISRKAGRFHAMLERDEHRAEVHATNVVLATGGKSIPKMGATGFAYDLARQYGLPVTDTRAALVPFTFPEKRFSPLSGVSTPARVTTHDGTAFSEALLFTHRGLSGPAILQASSYWREGQPVSIALAAPEIYDTLRKRRSEAGGRAMKTELATHLPARLADHLVDAWDVTGNLADQSDRSLRMLCDRLADWQLTPSGTEGYRTAEVTLGGIDTDALSSRTMEARDVPRLFAIGEAVDVTGWLGGYNFQWAWSSAMACAREGLSA